MSETCGSGCSLYICPTSGETECIEHGGFACCDHPRCPSRMTADHPTRTPDQGSEVPARQRAAEERYAAVLAEHMGCGPGEILTEFVGADTDGGPGEIAVGQACRSNAHNYAYWNGTCQFASDLAAALVAADPAPARTFTEGFVDGSEFIDSLPAPEVSRGVAEGDEGPCQTCGKGYPAWRADNALWNLVIGGPDATDDPGGMLCPVCFLRLADERAPMRGAWVVGAPVRPERVVRAEALREAAEVYGPAQISGLFPNPSGYTKARLHERADRIVRDAHPADDGADCCQERTTAGGCGCGS